uniref:glucuronosyltransferase n=1 Tax=Meloidogyne floridensis TaxID=298350 RepID=A0A915NUY7_9BILA
MCKCPSNQTKNPLFHRRVKRGFCSCLGGGGATDDDYESYRNPEKRPITEEMHAVQTQRKDKNGIKRALYICDNFFFSHAQFNDMLVYTDTEVLKIESVKFKIIPVPINDVNNIVKYRNKIITNQNGIFDRLQQNHYDIGIAEFNVMAGSFAVFEALGIEETFDVSCSVFVPQYLQFLGIKDLDYQFPEYSSAKPGDWVNGEWQKDGEENEREHERINEWAHNTFIENSQKSYNTLFNNYGISKNIKKPSPFDVLFKKIKYHFINQHPLIRFNNFPEYDKFVYIGGIAVEDDKLLTEGKQLVDNEPDCVILVTFGTAGYQTYPFGKMIKVFKYFSQCYFQVRANRTLQFGNGYTSEHPLPQREILCIYLTIIN